jgi:hypothetical protein
LHLVCLGVRLSGLLTESIGQGFDPERPGRLPEQRQVKRPVRQPSGGARKLFIRCTKTPDFSWQSIVPFGEMERHKVIHLSLRRIRRAWVKLKELSVKKSGFLWTACGVGTAGAQKKQFIMGEVPPVL